MKSTRPKDSCPGPEASVNLGVLRANLDEAKRLAPQSRVLAVVKADAYGHGLAPVARALERSVDALAVARFSEALALREAGLRARIVILSDSPSGQRLRFSCLSRFDWVIHDWQGIEAVTARPLLSPISVWLKLDTGMSRLGLTSVQFNEALSALHACPWVAEITLMSHFATADSPPEDEAGRHFAAQQLAAFSAAPNASGNASGQSYPRSMANSAALMSLPESRFEWTRPGIMLYGAWPGDDTRFADSLAGQVCLRPVMTLRAPLLAIRQLRAGACVGYGATWRAANDTLVGTVGIGYADGYPRRIEGARALVRGLSAPLIGRVSMDMLALDLRACPEARPGDWVTLWGEGLPVDEVARAAGLIPYAVLTGVSSRVPRRYIGVE